jgi:hypothetical protein
MLELLYQIVYMLKLCIQCRLSGLQNSALILNYCEDFQPSEYNDNALKK